jgi:RHS repeat-associated protein
MPGISRKSILYILLIVIIFCIVLVSIIALRFHEKAIAGSAIGALGEGAPNPPAVPLSSNSGTVYVYGRKLVASKTDQVSYHFQDVLGSNRMATDSAGKLMSRNVQYPYGRSVEEQSFAASEQRYLFTGKEKDEDLYYFGARYFSPRTARFVSVDPAGVAMASYTYGSDNPIIMRDPDGNSDRNEVSAGALQNWNIGVSAAVPLIAGIWRRDSFKDIAKNTLLGAMTGAGSFEIKKFVGQQASNDFDFLAAGLAEDFVGSVRRNAIRNEAPLGRLQFNYLMFDATIEGGSVRPGINVVKLGGSIARGIQFNGQLQLGRTFRTGVPTFVGKLDNSGGAGDYGSIIIDRENRDLSNKYDFGSYNMQTQRHEFIHQLQFRGEQSFGAGIGPDSRDEMRFQGINIHGFSNLLGDGLMRGIPLGAMYSTNANSGNPSDCDSKAYDSNWNWVEREAYGLTK